MPHRHNTFAVFSYLESGVIILNPSINNELKSKAQCLIDLVGIDRLPGHANYSPKDKRWEERKKAWELAKRYLSKFNKGRCDIETIKDLALSCGFWSIWMTVFEDHEDVRTLLISSFPGTRSEFLN